MALNAHLADVIAGTAKPIIDVGDAAQTLKITRDIDDLLSRQVIKTLKE